MSETTVWVIETGDYEQRHVAGVAASLDMAVEGVKARYGPPYVVEWQPLKVEEYDTWTRYMLTGKFAAVPGHSTDHTAYFEIVPERLWTAVSETVPGGIVRALSPG